MHLAKEVRNEMDAAIVQIAKAVRYAVGSNQRTARLALLIIILMIGFYLML
jgi:hypothetical protein